VTAGGKAQPFDRWNDDVQSLTVGGTGTFLGYTSNLGAFRPHALSVGGIEYFLVNTSTNAIEIAFSFDGSNTQASDWAALSITVQEWGSNPLVLTWNAVDVAYDSTDAAFASFIQARVGRSLRLEIRPG